MASITCTTTKHVTLTTTTADTVTCAPDTAITPFKVEILNRDPAVVLYYRLDGTTAVSAADGTYAVLPGQSVITHQSAGHIISIVGNGNAYSVHRLPAGTV